MTARLYIHPVDVHVGRRIRQRRMEFGWTLSELSRRVGIGLTQIQRHESGQHTVKAIQLLLYAGALEVGVDYFFEGSARFRAGPAVRIGAIAAVLRKRETIELTTAFLAIRDRHRRQLVLKLVRSALRT